MVQKSRDLTEVCRNLFFSTAMRKNCYLNIPY